MLCLHHWNFRERGWLPAHELLLNSLSRSRHLAGDAVPVFVSLRVFCCLLQPLRLPTANRPCSVSEARQFESAMKSHLGTPVPGERVVTQGWAGWRSSDVLAARRERG